jgi:hypothetical protein
VLNFTAELAEQLLYMASTSCSTFVARSFSQRLDIMRVADNFPTADDFPIAPSVVIERDLYRFFVWHFAD